VEIMMMKGSNRVALNINNFFVPCLCV